MWSDEQDFGKLLAGSAALEAYDMWNQLYRCVTGNNLPIEVTREGLEKADSGSGRLNPFSHLTGPLFS